jgi:hypothetical protein
MILTSSNTNTKARPREQQRAPENSYRCPACGEMVENRDLGAVRFHHDHVLHPRMDVYVTLPAIAPGITPNAAGNQNPHD